MKRRLAMLIVAVPMFIVGVLGGTMQRATADSGIECRHRAYELFESCAAACGGGAASVEPCLCSCQSRYIQRCHGCPGAGTECPAAIICAL